MIFLQADLSQAENRVGLMLTRDPRMIELARTAPWELDMHSFNAGIVFGDDHMARMKRENPSEFKELRQLGKAISHGGQRGMGGQKLSDRIFKVTSRYIPPDVCDKHLAAYMRYYAPLKDYFKDIRLQIVKYRALLNSWGRLLRFTYDHLDDDAVFREAYSFLPQSEVADLLNQYGFRPLYAEMMRRYNRPVNLQVHDSLLVSVPAEDAYDVAMFLKDALERPRIYYGAPMTIPVSFSVGSTWDVEYEFAKPFSRAEFDERAWDCDARSRRIELEPVEQFAAGGRWRRVELDTDVAIAA